MSSLVFSRGDGFCMIAVYSSANGEVRVYGATRADAICRFCRMIDSDR